MIKIVIIIFLFSNLFAKNIIVDKKTSIVWQDTISIPKLDWQDAKKYCNNLIIDGYSDWELPTIDQLMTITDKKKYKPSLKTSFKHFKSDYYWTSSEYVDADEKVWIVSFLDGGDFYNNKKNLYYVRCVRK